MRARLVLVLSMVAALVLVPSAAQAGGGAEVRWEGDHTAYHLAGTAVRATATVHDWGFAWIGDGPWYVYLVEWRAGSEAGYPPPNPIWLGRARVTAGPGAHTATATFSFVVPDVPSGEYAVLMCDLGCRNQFGDFFGESLPVAESALEIRLLKEMNQRGQALWREIYRMDNSLADGLERLERSSASNSTVSAWEERITRMESQIEGLEARAAAAQGERPWWLAMGVASTLLALGGLAAARRPSAAARATVAA
jgi:hypothetical protein